VLGDGTRDGLAFWWVDVFATRAPVSGNRLMVFVPAGGVFDDDALCQRVAQEVAFSEVAFLVPAQDPGADDPGRYRARVFTPAGELAYAGHPTLGSAVVWALETAPMVERVHLTQATSGATLRVEVERRPGEIGHMAWMAVPEARFDAPVPERQAVAAALGVDAAALEAEGLSVTLAVGPTRQLLVPVEAGALPALAPSAQALADLCRACGAHLVYAFSPPGVDGRSAARAFAPALGITEDPATGSAAGYVGRLLADRGRLPGDGRLTIDQGREAGRPSELRLRHDPAQGLLVGGAVRTVARGRILPDLLA
jgi:trans-2,3-dihydro-3-hydroxyanthranilate isomerase